MRTQAEWKVDTHIRAARGPTSSATRERISSAALLVKVMARICEGAASPVAIRWAMRRVSTRVFPDPAPATMSRGPPRWTTDSRCGPVRPTSSSSAGAGAGPFSRAEANESWSSRPGGRSPPQAVTPTRWCRGAWT